jgi:hypothetical protein
MYHSAVRGSNLCGRPLIRTNAQRLGRDWEVEVLWDTWQLELEIIHCLIPDPGAFEETLEGPLSILCNWCRLYRNGGTSRGAWSMVVVVVHECWLIGWCQSVVGRLWGKLPPLCGSWVLIALIGWDVGWVLEMLDEVLGTCWMRCWERRCGWACGWGAAVQCARACAVQLRWLLIVSVTKVSYCQWIIAVPKGRTVNCDSFLKTDWLGCRFNIVAFNIRH